jgi:hypothetical protein
MIRIEAIDGDIPRATRLMLSCDGDHGLFPVEASFEHADGYVGQYRLAMHAGWKDTVRDGVRVFFGPCCSGKL